MLAVVMLAAFSPRKNCKRKYLGKDCMSAGVTSTVRAYVADYARRPDVERNPNSREHQASKHGGVFKYIPIPDKKCCTKWCLRHYGDPNDETVKRAREPLYDRNLTRDELRTKYSISFVVFILLLCYYYFIMTGS